MKLASSAPLIDPGVLAKYISVLREHADSSAETFWNDPRVHCDFCKESAGLAQTFSRQFPRFGSRIAFEGNHTRVIPTIGQLTEEHSLLVSDRHVTSSAQLEDAELQEIVAIGETWVRKLEGVGKTSLMFEHGVPFESTSYGGCGICHSHIHLLSIPQNDQDFGPALAEFLRERQYDPRREEINRWSNIKKFRDHPYIAIRIGHSKPIVFVFPPNQPVESQLMRQFTARRTGNGQPEWDWRSPKDPEAIKLEESRLRQSLAELHRIFAQQDGPRVGLFEGLSKRFK